MFNRSSGKGEPSVRLPMLLLYAILVAGYFVLRYDAKWAEVDTSSMTLAIDGVASDATILPHGNPYVHGFAYQTLALYILSTTGLSVEYLQSVVWPFFSAIGLALTAYFFYNQVSEDSKAAVLAGLLLFFQGDVVFVILRGSHEKLDWPLMMLALALLHRSISRDNKPFLAHVLLFYLVVFAVVTTNLFFSSTFLFAIVFSLLLGSVIVMLLRRRSSLPVHLRRLVITSLACGVLLFIEPFYIYQPALGALYELRHASDQLAAMLMNFEVGANPYEYVGFGWINREMWLGLTMFTWLLIVLSAAEWLWQARRILRKQQAFGLRASLVWLLYPGFAFQIALSIVIDFAGVLSQNLQLRIFPGFTILAVILVATAARRIVSSISHRDRVWRVAWSLCLAAIGWFAVASVLKATNEPLLSNKWGFYASSEDAAIHWVEENVRYAHVWTGVDERLREIYRSRYAAQFHGTNYYHYFTLLPDDRYVVLSEREKLRATRIGIATPNVLSWNRIYDDGDVELFHRRPRTPYQK